MWALGKLGLLGRSTRSAIAGFLILSLVGGVAIWFVGLARFRAQVHGNPFGQFAVLPLWAVLAESAAGLVFLWLAIRRINDQDRPGWLALLFPAASAPALAGIPVPAMIPGLLNLALLAMLFLPPTIGPNRYGPDPRGWKSRAHYLERNGAGYLERNGAGGPR